MYENLSASKADLIFDDFEHSYIDNATDPESVDAGGGYSEHTVASLFGRLNYDLMDRYMLTATVRRDGSSRFGEENKYGIFPSASIGWVISREPFMSGFSNIFNILFTGYMSFTYPSVQGKPPKIIHNNRSPRFYSIKIT